MPPSATDLPILDHAIEVFARGFCFTRSFAHPYLAERVGPLWVMRDGPRRSGDYRNEEWLAHGVDPVEVDSIARKHRRGRFAICAIRANDEPETPLREQYKKLGYRLGRTEPMFVHRLQRVPRFASPAAIERVTTADAADRLAKAARARQLLPEHFADDAPLRQYVAFDGTKPIGWVRSIVAGDSTWCSNMYVEPKFRRRGIARAMLARMLRDDRAAGAKSAVLLASHAGAKLYPVVGYEQIGMLLLFTPRK